MPDRTGIFFGWSVNLCNFLGLGVEAGASPMYPQKMRVPPLGSGAHGRLPSVTLIVSSAARLGMGFHTPLGHFMIHSIHDVLDYVNTSGSIRKYYVN